MHKVSFLLLVIGGLNWLLVAFGWGLDMWGIPMGILKVVYILVGLSAIYEIAMHKKMCKMCDKGMSGGMKTGM